MDKNKVIETLQDDKAYYGAEGKKYLSNSYINDIIDDPEGFKYRLQNNVNLPPTVEMLFGRYFHESILEPHKADEWTSVSIKGRNTNKYREAREQNNGIELLLDDEIEFAKLLTHRLFNVKEIFDLIDLESSEKETPAIGTVLDGGRYVWKAKADIISRKHNLVIDLKTTSNHETFKTSVYKYNYHTQAYIYRELFGMNFLIVGICKKTLKPFIWEPSDYALEHAEEKLRKTEDYYHRYIDPNGAGEDASQLVIKYNF